MKPILAKLQEQECVLIEIIACQDIFTDKLSSHGVIVFKNGEMKTMNLELLTIHNPVSLFNAAKSTRLT